MNKRVFSPLFVALLVLAVPAASAQEFGIKAAQRSVEVEINKEGEILVKHMIDSADSTIHLDLIYGASDSVTVTGTDGTSKTPVIVGDNSILILPTKTDSIVEYYLEDVLEMKDGYWTLNFRYLESTVFSMPEDIEMFYLNSRPLDLGDKREFICHGCQMVLEYSFDESKVLKNVEWEGLEFDVEIISLAETGSLVFDQPSKSMTLDVVEGGKFLTAVIPLELLWEPYTVFLGDEIIKISTNNNGTHASLTMRPDAAGEIIIVGTTVIPEFPIIWPLAIGFLAVLSIPLLRKFNLR